MKRRWYDGRVVECKKGFRFRCIEGTKERGNSHLYGDLVIQQEIDGRWRNVPHAALFVLADFLYENEEVLYPREHGKKGGEKLIGEMRKAAKHGWERAQEWLEYEQGSLDEQEDEDWSA